MTAGTSPCTCAAGCGFTMRAASQVRHSIAGTLRGQCDPARVAACDGDVDAHPSIHVAATGAWKRASGCARDRDGLLRRTLPAEAPQQWSWCATAREAHGAERRCSGVNRTRRTANAHRSGRRIAARGCRKPSRWQPRDPSRVSGSPTGFPGRRNRRLPGRVVPAPGLPTRHPRTRRTPGLTAGDGRRVGGATCARLPFTARRWSAAWTDGCRRRPRRSRAPENGW